MNTTANRDFDARWAIAALLVLPLFLALPSPIGETWAYGDLIRQFHPWKELGKQALLNHEWPLWNPYAYCGIPLLGNFQSGLFYPFHLPFYFLDFAPALSLHLAFHFFIAGLGAYVLSRDLGLSKGPALLAALAWQSNSFLLSRVEFMSALSAYAWTPWIIAAFALRWRLRTTALLIAVQALAGYPLELAYTLLLSLAVVLATRPKDWCRLLGAWALGLAVAAPVLFTGFELWRHSSRAAGAPDEQAVMAVDFKDMLSWLWGGFGEPWPKRMSLPILAVVLAFFARGGRARFGWALFLIGLGLSFGVESSLHLQINRHPGLALAWCSLGLAFAGGVGAQNISERWKVPVWAWPLAALSILAPQIYLWARQAPMADVSVYDASPSAKSLAKKMTPGTRILLSSEVQSEDNTHGRTTTEALKPISLWMQANTAAPVGIHDANGYDPLVPSQVARLLNQVLNGNVKHKEREALYDFLGVEALIDWEKGKPGKMAIHKRNETPMRAWVEEAKGGQLEAKLEEHGMNEVKVTLPRGHHGGLLNLTDTRYGGWRAWVDGVPVKIMPLQGVFRSVEVGPGAHEVLMKYKPISFYLGLIVSGIALFLIFFII